MNNSYNVAVQCYAEQCQIAFKEHWNIEHLKNIAG